MNAISRRQAIKLGAIGAAGVVLSPFLNTIAPDSAFAAIETLPNEDASVSSNLSLNLYYDNASWTWNNISGEVKDGGTDGYCFMVPLNGRDRFGGWEINNFLTINFTNVGSINGRAINALLTLDKLSITRRTAMSLPDPVLPLRLSNAFVPQFGDATSYNFGRTGFFHQMFIDYTVAITWADTGAIVSQPFYQRISDLDQSDTYFREAWTAGNGFTGDFYVYEDCKLQINGNQFAANGSTTGFEQEIQQAGVVAKTKNGKFSGRFEEGWCATALEIFSELTDIPSPEKLLKVTQ